MRSCSEFRFFWPFNPTFILTSVFETQRTKGRSTCVETKHPLIQWQLCSFMVLPRRRAYHMIYDPSYEDALDYISGTEWNGVVPDIGVPELSPEKTTFYERMQLRQRSQDQGIEWGLHAPCDDVSLFTTYPPIQQAILDYFRDVIDFARDVCKTRANIVVHAG